MNKRKSRLLALATALVLTTALFAGVVLATNPRFENSDDMLIVKAFMGYEGGEVTGFSFYLHPLLVWALGLVSRALPGVPCFSFLQLGCLYVSIVLIAYSLLRAARSRLMGLLAAVYSMVIFGLFYVGRVQYTTTAALMGTAACALMLSAAAPREDGSALVSRCASCLMMLCTYLFRPEVFEPLALFWLICALWSVCRTGMLTAEISGNRLKDAIRGLSAGFRDKRGILTKLLYGFLAVLAGLFLWRVMSYNTPELQEYFHYMNASNELMDYHEDALKNASAETLEKVNWSEAERDLVVQSFFMDENINTETLRAVVDSEPEVSAGEHLSAAWQRLVSFFRENPRDSLLLLLSLLLCVLALTVCRSLPGILLALCGQAGALLMILYLGWRGRVLGRAVECALLPAIVIPGILCLIHGGSPLRRAIAEQKEQRHRPRILPLILVVCILAVGMVYGRETFGLLRAHPDAVSQQREADLEGYALQHPDQLIMRTPDLLRDTRLLPFARESVPRNIIIWGDWYCRTPSWYAQLEKYGFDGRHFTPSDYLRDNLRFAETGEVPSALLVYLGEGLHTRVTAVPEETFGSLIFYRFEEEQSHE